jgi:ketosteroid isomerase-like protein/gamma-glutamylcyclotransferase (GGCT)/AIG2-like uncharacterized protein YtfP
MYFAYGSNMSASIIAEVAPRHGFIGRAYLPRHRLAFTRRSVRTGTGVADIVADPSCTVWGVLYELEPDDLDRLDRKEGFGWAYGRRDVRVFDDAGVGHSALAFVVLAKASTEIQPSDQYVRQLIDAATERSLPRRYVDSLRVWRPARPDPPRSDPPTTRTGSHTMAQGNVEVIRGLVAALNRMDVDAMVVDFYTPDAEFVPAVQAELEGTVYRGSDAIRAYYDEVREVWEELHVDLDDVREAGGTVIANGSLTLRGRTSGAELVRPWGFVFELENGRVRRQTNFADRV